MCHMTEKSTNETAQRIIWLIKVRFFVIFSILVIVLSAHLLGMQFQFFPIYLLLGFAFLYKLLFYYLGVSSPYYITTNFYNYLRIFTDLLITTIMVHFSGGVDSPFHILYFIDLATTALFFGSPMGILMSGHAIIFYSANNLLEALQIIPHYQIAILPNVVYSDPGYFTLKSFSLFFIALALIYTMSYLSLKIHEKQEEIEKLSNDKINFMNMVAHELRSPLTSIQEYISLALEGLTGPLTQDQTKALTIIQKQSRRINNLVNDLLDLEQIENKIYISVKDEGIGVEPGDLDHLFEKFYRTSNKEGAKRKGTGLGMALSKSIIEKHGGRMWAESEGRGKGAIFIFTLPIT